MAILDILEKAKTNLEIRIEEAYGDLAQGGPVFAGPFQVMIREYERQLSNLDKKIAIELKTVKPEFKPASGTLKVIKIFLASSFELKQDREEFEIFINRENINLVNQNIFLRLIVWENFIDAVSQTRIQDEYNQAIRHCDIFISLFHTKSGIYTQEEFDIALVTFRSSGKPLVYTYIKNPDSLAGSNVEDSLEEFKNKLRAIGHFPTSYQNSFDLKYQLKMQLEKVDLKNL